MWARSRSTSSSSLQPVDGALGTFTAPEQARSEKTSLMFTTPNSPGGLMKTLAVFNDLRINITRIESRLSKQSVSTEMIVDAEADMKLIRPAVEGLRRLGCVAQVIGSPEVPWFPRAMAELDEFVTTTLDAEAGDLDADHPGFHDQEYRARRRVITENAQAFRTGDEIPRVAYSPEEVETWGVVYNRLQQLFPQYACEQYLEILPLMEKVRVPAFCSLHARTTCNTFLTCS